MSCNTITGRTCKFSLLYTLCVYGRVSGTKGGMDMTSLCINWYQFNKEVIGRWVRRIVVLTSHENVGTSALYVSQAGTKNKMGFITFNFLVFTIWITRIIPFSQMSPILGKPWQRIHVAKSKLSTNNMCKIFCLSILKNCRKWFNIYFNIWTITLSFPNLVVMKCGQEPLLILKTLNYAGFISKCIFPL